MNYIVKGKRSRTSAMEDVVVVGDMDTAKHVVQVCKECGFVTVLVHEFMPIHSLTDAIRVACTCEQF
jgi:hypothetical protein